MDRHKKPNQALGPVTVEREAPVPCKFCYSVLQRKFPAEINIHFPGPKNLDKPTVWAFPKLLVCLNCGFTEFVLENGERERLRDNSSEAGGDSDLFGT